MENRKFPFTKLQQNNGQRLEVDHIGKQGKGENFSSTSAHSREERSVSTTIVASKENQGKTFESRPKGWKILMGKQ